MIVPLALSWVLGSRIPGLTSDVFGVTWGIGYVHHRCAAARWMSVVELLYAAAPVLVSNIRYLLRSFMTVRAGLYQDKL